PIALLRGAPHRDVAEAFIEFTLTLEAQKLWNLKVGAAGGPERFALRRLPVRKDFYADAGLKPLRSDPDANPFGERDQLVYHPEWTDGIFREMTFVIRVMCLDTHTELVSAWQAIERAGRPAKAVEAFEDLSPIGYDEVLGRVKKALNS